MRGARRESERRRRSPLQLSRIASKLLLHPQVRPCRTPPSPRPSPPEEGGRGSAPRQEERQNPPHTLYGDMNTSTRRFFALPSCVSLQLTGRIFPNPLA
jgi:hypothetical protein